MTPNSARSAPARFGKVAADLVAHGLPGAVDEWARWALLDQVSLMVGGAGTRVVQASMAAAARHPGGSSFLVAPGSASPEWAALVLATSANALDYDDGHVWGGGVHAGSATAGALLAAAPDSLTLGQLRAALVVGYELSIRAGHLASPAVSGHDYRTSGYAAAIGAAAALAAVAGLLPASPATPAIADSPAPPATSTALIAASIRLAAAHAPVASFVSGGARESIGWAALTAVSTVDLAQAGLAPLYEESRVAVPAGPTLFDVAGPAQLPLSGAFGEEFLALGSYVKPYPCCRAAHAAIDAVLELLRTGRLDTEGDSPIVVGVPAGAATLTERAPVDLGEAQFAVPFLVGLTVARGEAGLRQLGRGPLEGFTGDPNVQRAIARVQLEVDDELERAPGAGYPARVTLPDSGATFVVRDALGSPERPMSPGQRTEKALDLLATALPAGDAEALRAAILEPNASTTLGQLRAMITRQRP